MSDEISERAAKVACVLHGKRPALDDELGCNDCGTVLCAVCSDANDRCRVCALVYEEEMQSEADARLQMEEEYDDYLEHKREEREEREREQWEREVAYERAIQRADSDAGVDVRQPDR